MNKFNELYNKIISEMKENKIINENIRHKHSHITPDGKIDYSDIFTTDNKTLNNKAEEVSNTTNNISEKTSNKELEDKKEYKAIFSFEEGTEIKADNFLDCKKAAYKYAEQSDRTEIRIFDPSENLVLAILYSKEGFDNGKHFKKIKGDEF